MLPSAKASLAQMVLTIPLGSCSKIPLIAPSSCNRKSGHKTCWEPRSDWPAHLLGAIGEALLWLPCRMISSISLGKGKAGCWIHPAGQNLGHPGLYLCECALLKAETLTTYSVSTNGAGSSITMAGSAYLKGAIQLRLLGRHNMLASAQ